MPWTPSEAKEFTHRADTPHKQEAWSKIANKALNEGHSDSSAIRIANDAVKNMGGRHA